MADLRRRKEGEAPGTAAAEEASNQSDRRSGAESSDHVGDFCFIYLGIL